MNSVSTIKTASSNSFEQWKEKRENQSIHSLTQKWAKRYVSQIETVVDTADTENRSQKTAQKLGNLLRNASVQAWSQTEDLIGKEIQRHGISHKYINPWEISEDAFYVYERVLDFYAQGVPPIYTARLIASAVGRIRKKYTATDARVIGFVSLQFHYTGEMLLKEVSYSQQQLLISYFKVIDDHLYMPLHRVYYAAAKHELDSPALELVRQLLSMSTDIATSICERVIKLYPRYSSYSGLLSDKKIKIASIRDTEMFQVYLWVCLLENNANAILQELFPLCVMLYPSLNVQWELVRQMIHLMGQEIRGRLGVTQQQLFQPYLQTLWELFSPEVFPESLHDF